MISALSPVVATGLHSPPPKKFS